MDSGHNVCEPFSLYDMHGEGEWGMGDMQFSGCMLFAQLQVVFRDKLWKGDVLTSNILYVFACMPLGKLS